MCVFIFVCVCCVCMDICRYVIICGCVLVYLCILVSMCAWLRVAAIQTRSFDPNLVMGDSNLCSLQEIKIGVHCGPDRLAI